MSVIQAIWTRLRSMGLTVVLGFLLCIFQSSESILVKLAGNRPDPHPSSAKLLFLAEFLKLLISYTLLSVERRQVFGLVQLLRWRRMRRCCRSSCKCAASTVNAANDHENNHESRRLGDEEEARGRGLLSKKGHDENDDSDSDDEDDDNNNNNNSNINVQQPSSTTSSRRCRLPAILLFAVPGAIYFFNNNLTFVLLSMMPAPTYVVLSNLKILTTGLFSYLFLHRMLSFSQWVSLGVLFLSTAISQVDLEKGLTLAISLQAFLLMILFCSLSAAASVFSEYVMKERFANESIHIQNMKLYMFGILFNGVTYLLSAPTGPTTGADGTTVAPAGFWSDMVPIHFMVILAYASLGLVTSAIIKFAGSITKVYASSMSMFFAALVSWLLLNDSLTVLFFVGCFGCCFALHLYYRVPASSATTEASTTILSRQGGEGNEGQERISTSSTASSTTLAATSPISKLGVGSLLTSSMSVSGNVDRSEYVSLETMDQNEEESRTRSNATLLPRR